MKSLKIILQDRNLSQRRTNIYELNINRIQKINIISITKLPLIMIYLNLMIFRTSAGSKLRPSIAPSRWMQAQIPESKWSKFPWMNLRKCTNRTRTMKTKSHCYRKKSTFIVKLQEKIRKTVSFWPLPNDLIFY